MNEPPKENGLTLKKRMECFCLEAVDKGILFSEAMDQFERCFITEVLRRNNDNIIRTAAALGIHRNTLSKKLSGWRG
ncbi:MAG: helix-turn-helix domain-containing protein [Acidobacteria bacterium]|nr:helix-turn-helix domain-containing protein [Acidobacteriota bacterium]